ncbi:MAG: VOC family protein [Acidobacteriota bacterium]
MNSLRGRWSLAVLGTLLAALAMLASQAASQAVEGKRRPPIVGIAHIALQVTDETAARKFYGDLLGFEEVFQIPAGTGRPVVVFKINERQYIEIIPGLPPGEDDRLSHLALETTNIEELGLYLTDKGITISERVSRPADGNLTLTVTDPEGHRIEFVQYLPGSRHGKAKGRSLSPRRISDRMLHVGLTVTNVAAADRFYKEALGFSEIWRGGSTDAVTSWINMRVPDGTDYIEYMLITEPPNRQRLGVLHHLALQVPDIQKALETLRQRPGADNPATMRLPQVGRNNRWQLNLFDPDGTRAELMEPFTMR